jgi:hypothetical protein
MVKRTQEEMAHDAFVISQDDEAEGTYARQNLNKRAMSIDPEGTCRFSDSLPNTADGQAEPSKESMPPPSPCSTSASTPKAVPTSPAMRVRAQRSDYSRLSVRELKERLAALCVSIIGVTEKTELVMMLIQAENPETTEIPDFML